MRAYPKYKNSGVPWLEHVPEHWETIKTKHLFSERVQKGYPNEPLLAATQTKGVVPKSMYENRTVEAQKDLHLLKLVEPGDFVISLRSFQGGIEYAYFRGIISPAYTVMVPKKRILPEYYRQLAKSKKFISLLQTCVTGIREGQNINYEILRNTPLPVPSEDEQQQISRFLDWQTSKIKKFIKAKKKLIALLKEQKQNVINEAVTKGINPDVELKDSGVEWLGQIPANWDDRFFFQSFREKSVKNTGLVEKNRLSLSYGRIIRKSIDSAEGLLPMSFETYQIVERGDLILRLTDLQNDHKSLRVGLVQERGIITSAYLCLRTFPTIIPEYAYLLLHAYDLRKVFYSMGGGVRQSIGFSELKRLPFPVPIEEEQKTIVAKINSECKGIDLSIEKAEREIELIQEYRTRLVSDVVTGKVDVRFVEIPDFEPVEVDLEAQDCEASEDELITEGIEDE